MEKILGNAWKNYTNNIFTFIGGFLISFLVPLAITLLAGVILFSPLLYAFMTSGLQAAVELIKANFLVYFLIPMVITGVVFVFTFAPFNFGFIYLIVSGSKKKKIRVSYVFDGVKKFWKKAIGQQVLYLAIITIVSLPFVKIGLDLLPIFSKNISLSILLGGVSIFLIWVIMIMIIAFFLIFWAPCIVIYNKSVVESMKMSVIKVRKNMLETFVIYLFIILISAIAGILENVVPLIPSIILTPLSVAIIVEACKKLK